MSNPPSSATENPGDGGMWTHLLDEPQSAHVQLAHPGDSLKTLFPGGFEFAVKANIEVAGLPASAGSPVFAGYLPEVDSPVVTALKRHGGRLKGLTNMHELAFGITSNNAVFGPVRNPFDPTRSAGGSSGGSAAAVAAGLVPVSLGTDTGGSISIPAALCAITGFRPSTGRWPAAGTIGLSWTRDTVGVHATSVAQLCMVDAWVTHDPTTMSAPSVPASIDALEPPRLGIPSAFLKDLHPLVAERFAAVVASLRTVADIVEVDLDEVLEMADAAQWDVVGYEAPRILSAKLAEIEDLSPSAAWEEIRLRAASPDVREILGAYHTAPVPAANYARAVELIDAARERYADVLASAHVDALLFPTLPTLPPHIGEDHLIEHLGTSVPLFPLFIRHTGPGTVLGTPAVTLPAGFVAGGLPVGINIQGHAHRDPQLLTIAAFIEAALCESGLSGPQPRTMD